MIKEQKTELGIQQDRSVSQVLFLYKKSPAQKNCDPEIFL